jgi:hypothetical protein
MNLRSLAALVFSLAAAVTAAQAQELPSRVGRVAFIEGRVSLFQDPDAGWEQAYVNSPVTSENSVWTDEGARAEVRISAVALRLDRYTQLDVARLGDDELDAFRVRHTEPNEILSFHTQNALVRLRGDGRYRIDFDPDRNESRVTVFAGEARIGDGRMVVSAGRSVLVFGADPPQFVEERVATDEFDRWVVARDERWSERNSTTYVSSYMTGYEELDGAGQWQQDPGYGTIWYPTRVAADWAPYRHGRWDYVRPWGWTWIDDASWGYAPFHYGRWVYAGNRWGWIPGERIARPVYAPALVAWVGGSGFSVGVSSTPAVGWYPLAPWDTYHPWFRASPTYVSRVNVVVRNSRPNDERYRNWQQSTRDRGTTVVDRRAMVDRQPIARVALPVNAEAIRRAQPVQQPNAVLPSRNDWMTRRREEPRQNVAAPTVAQQPLARPGVQGGQRQNQATPQAAPERNVVVRPDFSRRGITAAPQAASAPPAQRPADAGQQQQQRQAQERAQQEAKQQAERAQREAQQGQQQQQRQAQERAQQEAKQQAERAQREAQQGQQQQQRQAQDRAQQEAKQQAERAQREAQQGQQQQQRQAQERAQQEAKQQAERAQREAQQGQQQQQRQAQERAQQEAKQQAERAQREAQQGQQAQQQQQRQAQERAQQEAKQAQQQQQRQAQERAQQEAKQQQERAQREAQQGQQQQQRQAQERAQQEAKQQAERAQREAQQAQQQQQRQAQERAQQEAKQQAERAQREARQKEKEKDNDKDNDKGKGGKTQPQ